MTLITTTATGRTSARSANTLRRSAAHVAVCKSPDGPDRARYTDRRRLERWLYSGLHDLDFPFLYWHRPAWDLTVIGLSIGGLALSLTSIVLALKYFRRQYRKGTHAFWAREGREAR